MVRVSKIFRMLIPALLALLGFSCGRRNENWAEYGSPYASYKAKGIVVSEAGDSPIQGIRATLKDSPNGMYILDTIYTDSSGLFSLRSYESPWQNLYYVELLYLDGEENGSFVRMVVPVDYTNATFTGGSGWYDGEAEIDLGTLKMILE